MTILKLPFASHPMLAVGAELKNHFCLACNHRAWLSEPNGDMEFLDAQTRFTDSLRAMQESLQISPERVAYDLHPGYHSSRWAKAAAASWGVPAIGVQHHHAHIAAVMAEHGLCDGEQVIGIALDGTGYGTDSNIWGGEILVAGYRAFTRAAQLRYVPLPGGDSAVRKPYRMALAHLWAAGIPWDTDLPPAAALTPEERRILLRQLEREIGTVPTSSMGRLFDATAALIGIRQVVEFEGQAAIELEACASTETDAQDAYPFDISGDAWPLQLDPGPMLRQIIAEQRAGVAPAVMSARFHAGVAQAVVTTACKVRQRAGLHTVALSGGVFQNARLLRLVRQGLDQQGFTVLAHRQLSPNDSSLALGQAAIAQFQMVEQSRVSDDVFLSV